MLLDTNILIAYFEDERAAGAALETWRQQGVPLVISSITVAELLSYTRLSDSEVENIRELVKTFISIPFDDRLAAVAGMIRRKYGLEVPDSGIIATAIQRGVRVVTRDKQMQKVKEVDFVKI